MQGSQPVGNLLNACGVQRRSVRYRGCWTPPPAACQTPRRPSPKAPSMGADLDRASACARTMLGIFEPECRVPGLRQSAAALLRQIAWAGLSGRVTAEALPRCFGGVRRAGSEHLTVQEPAYPLGPRFAGPRQGPGGGCAPSTPLEARTRAEVTGGWLARSCVLAARQGRGSRGRARAHPAGRAHRQQPQPDRPLGQLVLDEVGPEAQHLVQNGARIIGPGADPLIGFNLARRYRQLDRRPFGVEVP